MPYAEGTSVTVESSKAEIERTLKRYGADSFLYGYDTERALIGFRAKGRQVRFFLPLPKQAEVVRSARGRTRNYQNTTSALEKETRRRWRALALAIKAKLEVVASGITTFDDEFLAHIVLPTGETFGQWVHPQIAAAYERGEMPPLLPAPRGAS